VLLVSSYALPATAAEGRSGNIWRRVLKKSWRVGRAPSKDWTATDAKERGAGRSPAVWCPAINSNGQHRSVRAGLHRDSFNVACNGCTVHYGVPWKRYWGFKSWFWDLIMGVWGLCTNYWGWESMPPWPPSSPCTHFSYAARALIRRRHSWESGSGHFLWTYPPGHLPLPDNFSFLQGVGHFPLFHHRHSPIYNIKRSTVTRRSLRVASLQETQLDARIASCSTRYCQCPTDQHRTSNTARLLVSYFYADDVMGVA